MNTRSLPITAAALCMLGTGLLAESPAPSIEAKDGARMLLVPAGKFIMGSGEGRPDETPPHECDLPAFYMDATEVTNAQYARYLQDTGATPPPTWQDSQAPKDKEHLPVSNVSWFDAMKYAIWAGKRLPTEAEWEKAARGTDGRRYPWGNAEPKPGEAIARLDGARFLPVGSFPKSNSPYGCEDMAGNAWEWTADWYDGYPGSTVRSPHFGKQYKVMRGSGTAAFYTLNENIGRCASRGRILPYAGEDYLGFRCAKDVDPGKPAYDAKKVLADAEQQLQLAIPKPVKLSYETEYEGHVATKRFPIEIVGQPNQSGMVRGGVPFPKGLVKDIDTIQVLGADGRARPVQHKMLTPWKDGSARWVLLDFPAVAGDKCTVTFDGTPAKDTATSLQVNADDAKVVVDTGAAVFTFTRDNLLKQMTVAGKPVFAGSMLDLTMDIGHLHPLPAERMNIEDKGPLHATIRLSGSMADEAGKKSPIQYDLRTHMLAGSARANLMLTFTNMQSRTGQIRDRTPMAKMIDGSVHFALPASADRLVLATDQGVFAGPIGGKTELLQPDTVQYSITRDDQEVAKGTRCPGWMSVPTPAGWFELGVRHFWQNYTEALTAAPNEVVLRLWADKEPQEFEATIAKTHEIVLDVAAQEPTAEKHPELEPLRLGINPAWSCGTEALGGPMLPRCKEAIAQIPYWVLAREGSMQRLLRATCYSWRDFGDTRHGGETKGANAFHNLEYDVPFNFILQYLATGHTWYLDAAEIQCRHQTDIDTDHFTGHPYKHERFHTTWYADIAHMFLRGLVLHYWTTGEQRSLEVARAIADHIAPLAVTGEGFGNERQIGWGLYALSGIYEATLDEKYLNAASALCDRLVSGMSPHGKFNIRWDNRMSLMNGMAMNGMMSVQELNGDEKLADGLMRLCRRTLGFYPEYALRSLHGYAWALTRTNDPRFLDVLEKTWTSSMEFMQMGIGDASAEEVHAWRFPRFLVKYGLFPVFNKPPTDVPDPITWQGQWLPGDRAEMFIRCVDGKHAPVMVLLEGIADGTAELFDGQGKPLASASFAANGKLYQGTTFALPGGADTYRLVLKSYGARGWEFHHDASSIATLFDPKAEQINMLCPKAYCYLRPAKVAMEEGKEKIDGLRILFEAIGENVHSITLYDPKGNVYATTSKYMVLEDKSRYELELKCPMSGEQQVGWGIEAWQAKVLEIQGFLPYWASSPEQLFNPEEPRK